MLKKILTCFTLLVALAFASTVSAKTAELTGINAYDLDARTVRIEISYRGGPLKEEDISSRPLLKGMTLNLENCSPGKPGRVLNKQIQSGARDLIKEIDINETGKKQTSVHIKFKTFIGSDGATINLEPDDRKEKKDARIVIDVRKVDVDEAWPNSGKLERPDDPYSIDDYNGDGKIVVLDPGHGGSDSGAIGPTGVREKDVSLSVSLKAQKLLAAAGYHVVMTRTTDIDVAAPGVPDGVELQARVDKSPPNTDIFISVHCNAFSNSGANGVESYYAPANSQGAHLARLLNEELLRLGGLHNRGVKSARFYVIRHSKCPASLIELGFITNHREEKLLADEDYQQKLAQAILNAVNRYFNQGGND